MNETGSATLVFIVLKTVYKYVGWMGGEFVTYKFVTYKFVTCKNVTYKFVTY